MSSSNKITSILGSTLLLSAIGGLLFKKKKKRS
ncbi:LPXTG cell wall anchor domain-containing protein [Pseudolactococcus piscium]